MSESGCQRCSKPGPLGRLYGERGGPMVCFECGSRVLADITKAKKHHKRVIESLGAGLMRSSAEPGELSLELLMEAITLTHPDKHPPERLALAQSVTSALLALRPYVKPAPKPPSLESQPPPIRARAPVAAPHISTPSTDAKPLPESYPCAECRHTVPHYYCDICREKYDAKNKQEREKVAAYARDLRARKRARWRAKCLQCAIVFQPKRRDSIYCTAGCRQRAFRARVTDQ